MQRAFISIVIFPGNDVQHSRSGDANGCRWRIRDVKQPNCTAVRGRGYGLGIRNAAIAHAGTRVIGLDGVAAQQENYKKSGFALAYANVR